MKKFSLVSVVQTVAFVLLLNSVTGQIAFQGDSLLSFRGGGIAPVGFSESAVGDVDGDGDVDVFVTGGNGVTADNTRLYFNDGDGGFSESALVIDGVYAGDMHLLDMDKDGDLDLFFSGYIGPSLAVVRLYENTGSGNFTSSNFFTDTIDQITTAVGDIDGDSLPEIIVAGYADGAYFNTQFTNLGSMSFSQVGGVLDTPVFDGRARFADLDLDGDMDLVMTGDDGAGIDILLFYDNTGGGFELATDYPGFYDSPHIEIGNIDGDGFLEVLVSGGKDGQQKAVVFDSNSPNTVYDYFPDTVTYSITGFSNGAAVFHDFTPFGGSNKDILLVGYNSTIANGMAKLFLNNGSLTEETSLSNVFKGIYGGDAEVGDFDGNGADDIFIHGYDNSNNPIAHLYFRYDIDGTPRFFRDNKPQIEPYYVTELQGLDFDKDGDEDVLVSGWDDNNQGKRELYKNEEGEFVKVPVPEFPFLALCDVDTADLNNDGWVDIIYCGEDGANSKVSVLTNFGGTGWFDTVPNPGIISVFNPAVSLGDVNNDGNTDALILGDSGGVAITRLYFGMGNGTFSNPVNFPGVSNGDGLLFDGNGDGDLDVFAMNSSTAIYFDNDGVGNFNQVAQPNILTSSVPKIATADLNLDGFNDLIVSGFSAGIKVYHNDGSGFFDEPNNLGSSSTNILVDDVEGDGDLDIILAGSFSETFEIHENLGNGTYQNVSSSIAEAYAMTRSGAALVDLNQDGKNEIIQVGYSSGGADGYGQYNNSNYFSRVYWNNSTIQFVCELDTLNPIIEYDLFGGVPLKDNPYRNSARFEITNPHPQIQYLIANDSAGVGTSFLTEDDPIGDISFYDSLELFTYAYLCDTALLLPNGGSGIEVYNIGTPTTGDYSVGMWFQPSRLDSGVVYSNLDSPSITGPEVLLISGIITLIIHQGGSTEVFDLGAAKLGKWHNIYFGKDDGADKIEAYLDGELVLEHTFGVEVQVPDSTHFFGQRDVDANFPWPGLEGAIGEISFWNLPPSQLVGTNIQKYGPDQYGFHLKDINPGGNPNLTYYFKHDPDNNAGVFTPEIGTGTVVLPSGGGNTRGPGFSNPFCYTELDSISLYRPDPACEFLSTDTLAAPYIIDTAINNSSGHLFGIYPPNNFKAYIIVDERGDVRTPPITSDKPSETPIYFSDSIELHVEAFPTDTAVELPIGAGLDIQSSEIYSFSNFTFDFWVISTPGSDIFTFYNGESNQGIQFYRSLDSLVIDFSDGFESDEFRLPFSADGKFHHLAVTHTQGDSIRFFVDGLRMAERAVFTSNDAVVFGSTFGNLGEGSTVGGFRAYNRALTDEEIYGNWFGDIVNDGSLRVDYHFAPNHLPGDQFDAALNGAESTYFYYPDSALTFKAGPNINWNLGCSFVASPYKMYYLDTIPFIDPCVFDSASVTQDPQACADSESLFSLVDPQEERVYALVNELESRVSPFMSGSNPKAKALLSPGGDSLGLEAYLADTAVTWLGANQRFGLINVTTNNTFSSGFSADIWAQLNSIQPNQILLENGDALSGFELGLANGFPYIEIRSITGGQERLNSPIKVEQGEWNQFAFSLDTANYLRLFQNGEFMDSLSISGNLTLVDTIVHGFSPTANATSAQAVDGSVYTVHVYNTAFDFSSNEEEMWFYHPELPEVVFAHRFGLSPAGNHGNDALGNGYIQYFKASDGTASALSPLHLCSEIVFPYQTYYPVKEPPIAVCKENVNVTVEMGDTVWLFSSELDSGSYTPCGNGFSLLEDTIPVLCDAGDFELMLIVEDEYGVQDSCTVLVGVITTFSDTIVWDASPVSTCPKVEFPIHFENNKAVVWAEDTLTKGIVSLPSADSAGTLWAQGISSPSALRLVQSGSLSGALTSGSFRIDVPSEFGLIGSLGVGAFFSPDSSSVNDQFLFGWDNLLNISWNGANHSIVAEFNAETVVVEVNPSDKMFFCAAMLTGESLELIVNANRYPITQSFPTMAQTVHVLGRSGWEQFTGWMDQLVLDANPANLIPSFCPEELMVHFAFEDPNDPRSNTGSLSASTSTFDDSYEVINIGVPNCEGCRMVSPEFKEVAIIGNGLDDAIELDSVSICLNDTLLLTTIDSIDVIWEATLDTSFTQEFVLDSSGYVYVSTIDSNACFTSDSVYVKMLELPVVTGPSDTSVCRGYELNLSASGAESYQWTHGINQGVPFTLDSSYTAIVTGTDSLGCSSQDSVVLTAKDAPIMEDLATVFSCEPLWVTLDAISNYPVEWSNGVENGDSIFVEQTLVLTASSVNEIGCETTIEFEVRIEPLTADAGPDKTICLGESLVLFGSGSGPFVWNHGQGDGATLFPEENSTYIVYAGEGTGCEVSDTMQVFVNPVPVIEAGEDQEVCEGESIILTASGGSFYQWNGAENGIPFVPPVSKEYIVEGFNDFGCSALDSLFVRVEATPQVEAVIGDANCSTPTGFIMLSALTPDSISYLWNTGSTESSLFDLFADNYSVTLTSPMGCTTTESYVVEQAGEFNISFQYGAIECDGDSTGSIEAFIDGAQNVEGYEVTWKNPDGTLITTGEYSLNEIPGGAYWFNVSKDGCVDKKMASLSSGKYIGVEVVPLDTNSAGYTISGPDENDGKIRAKITSAFGPYSYEWENGDTTSLVRANLGPGTYSILVVADNGCQFGDSITLFEPIGLAFPEAFSPNGDNLNDFFVVKNLELVPENTLIVYGVDGEEVYFASPYANDWGGVMCELNWPDGQYSYQLITPEKTYSGVVLLVRDE